MTRYIICFVAMCGIASAQFVPPAGVSPASDAKYFQKTGGEISGDTTVDGKVGIGTTSPAYPLVVKSSGSDKYAIRAENSTNTKTLGGIWQNSNNDGELFLTTSSNMANVRLSSNGSSYLNGGNVGIGTTAPSSKLEVAGTLQAGNTDINGTLDVNDTAVFDGNVGIGTPAPNYKLVVGGATDNQYIQIKSGVTSQGGYLFSKDGIANPGAIFYSHSTDQMDIRVNKSIAQTILSNGNVGIGTTTPTNKLEVAGTLQAADTTVNGTLDVSDTATFGGNVGIGTDDPTEILHLQRSVPNGAIATRLFNGNSYSLYTKVYGTQATGSTYFGVEDAYSSVIVANSSKMILGTTSTSGNLIIGIGTNEQMRIYPNNVSVSAPIKLTATEYADNAAAVAAGLAVGTVYRTGDILKIVH